MEIRKAMDQISEIHGHLSRTQSFRGYRAVPTALSGVFALAAAALQESVIGDRPQHYFVIYWLAIALTTASLAGGVIVYRYIRQSNDLLRRRTRTAVGTWRPLRQTSTQLPESWRMK